MEEKNAVPGLSENLGYVVKDYVHGDLLSIGDSMNLLLDDSNLLLKTSYKSGGIYLSLHAVSGTAVATVVSMTNGIVTHYFNDNSFTTTGTDITRSIAEAAYITARVRIGLSVYECGMIMSAVEGPTNILTWYNKIV